MKPIEFNRPKKFSKVQDLGSGACGETLLVRDDDMDCSFVIKKYHPIISKKNNQELFTELLERFKEEARILFRLNHKNIVRVFNFYDYTEHETAYIVMEYVEGSDIIDALAEEPLHAEKVFEGIVEGFCHLHEKNILHRDIRRENILIDKHGIPKIIDFGFGKNISTKSTKDKSISLNWWCETPLEFEESKYDFETEVYFVGKLFEIAIKDLNLENFKYRPLINKMIKNDPKERIQSFSQVHNIMMSNRFDELKFEERELEVYRKFSTAIRHSITEIDTNGKIEKISDKIIDKLESSHRDNMLEDYVVNFVKILRIFVAGSFRYNPKSTIRLELLTEFILLLKSSSDEKKRIIMANLSNKLEEVPRTNFYTDDDIPF